uniref:Uroplakin 3B n=1 Tax=Chelydra serpentina TaxID=8475 RepID=A0A8C3S028_CHESE
FGPHGDRPAQRVEGEWLSTSLLRLMITLLALEGKNTSSTFVLEQPRCVFNDTVSDIDEIWLVVSLSNAISRFTRPTSLQSLPAFQQFPENPNYMTLGTSSLNYPCDNGLGQITVLRVGNETGCVFDTSRPDCNGPLPGPGPYRASPFLIKLTSGYSPTKAYASIPLLVYKVPQDPLSLLQIQTDTATPLIPHTGASGNRTCYRLAPSLSPAASCAPLLPCAPSLYVPMSSSLFSLPRVKFLAMSPATGPKAETQWSAPITLKTGN